MSKDSDSAAQAPERDYEHNFRVAPERDWRSDPLLQHPRDFDVQAYRQGTTAEPIDKRIAGLRPLSFWLLFALLGLVIVGATVGGAVGGTLAVKNHGGAPSSTAVVTVTKTTTVTSAAPSTPIPLDGIAQLYCANGFTYNTTSGAQFKEYCGVNWGSGLRAEGGGTVQDMKNVFAATFQSCMDQCALYNRNHPSAQNCKAVAYTADLGTSSKLNCWLKSGPSRKTYTLDCSTPPSDCEEMWACAALL